MVVSITALAVYLFFPTKNYYWDGIYFAQTIEDAAGFGQSLLHPNHLIYNFVGYGLYKAVLGLGIGVRALTVLQVANCFFSAAAAGVFYFVLKRALRSSTLAGWMALLFSFSATWWKYSIDADSYILSVIFMLSCFWLILPDMIARPFLVAFLHSIAMCFHQLAVFFFPVIVVGLYFQTAAVSHRERVMQVLKYSITAFLITFGAYSASFYWLTSSLDPVAFFRWLTSFSPDVGFNAKFADSVRHTLQGQIKLFFEGRFSFFRETFGPVIILLTGVLLAAIVGLVLQIFGIFRNPRLAKPESKVSSDNRLLWLCVLWAGIYLVFLFVWLPHNTFYRLFYFPAFIIIAGIFVKRRSLDETRPWLVPLLVIVVALSNFLFFVYPLSRVRGNTPLSMAIELNAAWSQQTVVYYSKMESDNQLMKYFNPATNWKLLEEKNLASLKSDIESIYASGGDVWMDISAYESIQNRDGGIEWLDRHLDTEHQYRLIDKAYKVLFVRLKPAL